MKKDNHTLDLGRLTGKILIFGGVYSNFQALSELKNIAEANNIASSNIICTGDIVGYCAEPENCIQLLKKWNIKSILGNVELQLSNDEDNCGCNFEEGSRCDTFSTNWYPYAKSNISNNSLNWIKSLPKFIKFKYLNYQCFVLHGSFFNPSEFIFKSTPWVKKQENFKASSSDIIFAGHSGLPFHHSYQEKYWINAGVIGMPANDGTSSVWYLIIEEKNKQLKIQHLNFNYDYQSTYHLMIKNGLPKEYANTLKTGIWDNCEILPSKETSEQGKKIIGI